MSATTIVDLDGLKALRGQLPVAFSQWGTFVPPGMTDLARKAFLTLVDELISHGSNPLITDVLCEIQRCIEMLNSLHNDNMYWITTGERDDIGEILEKIISLVNLDDLYELQDGTIWRDW